jgi:hypothetical protein
MIAEDRMMKAAKLRLRLQMNNRLRLESLAALSRVFREYQEYIDDELLASLVLAVPEELIGETEGGRVRGPHAVMAVGSDHAEPTLGKPGNPPGPLGKPGNPPGPLGKPGNPPGPLGKPGNPPAHPLGKPGNPPSPKQRGNGVDRLTMGRPKSIPSSQE